MPLTQEEFCKRCESLGWVPLGEYRGSKTAIPMKCPLCARVTVVKPNSVFTGGTQSCGCLQRKRASERRRLSLAEVQRRFVENGFPPPSEYRGSHVPVIVPCPRCGKPFPAIPSTIFSGHTTSCGCYNREQTGERNRKDITGQKHEFLVAIRPTSEKQHHKVIWEFLCTAPNCGKTVKFTIGQWRAYSSCGCQHFQQREKHRGWKGHGGIPGAFWCSFRNSARKRHKLSEITIQDALKLFIAQGGKCALTGMPLTIAIPYKGTATTAGIDRIDNNKGYVLGNVHWIHKTVNMMKGVLDLARFRELCQLVLTPIRDTSPAPACEIKKQHKNFRGWGNIPCGFWRALVQGTSSAKKYSSQRGRPRVELHITPQQAWDLFLRQNGRCAFTGLELDFSKRMGGHRKGYYRGSASLDRIDSKGHYTIDNVQWVHKDFNSQMKWDLDEETFKQWCRRVAEFAASGTSPLSQGD
jgi:hypothetical protein